MACGPAVDQQDAAAFPVAAHLTAKVEGFQVETVKKGDGEWLSIAKDPQGRLLVSPRKGKLLRFDVSGGAAGLQIDTLDVGIIDCQGLLYAYGSLYMMGENADTVRGVYRLKDLDGQGKYGEPVFLREFPKNGDHTGHTLALGPDGLIYFLTGNENKLPRDSAMDYVSLNWDVDHLNPLPLLYGKNQIPPGGFVLRTDSLGQKWQFLTGGLRNPYDMCFSPEGELFTFDSDMEWDFNLPWYRPTRVNHLVSGGDFAWRPGVAKRFDYFPDVWPSVVDFGRGSPTATCFGTGARFPEAFQRTLFVGDWSYGKIYSLELQPNGASYTGKYEVFVTGQPLNITDMVVGDDGALYFTTGGNGTDTGLFRVKYTGKGNTAPAQSPAEDEHSRLRALRKQLEAFHFSKDTAGLAMALQYTGHPDRFIRNAARVILERNDPDVWAAALNQSSNAEAQITLLTALIREDSAGKYSDLIFEKLQALDYGNSASSQQLGLLRLYGLGFLRSGKFPKQQAVAAYNLLLPHYPSANDTVNKEMSRLLAYLSPHQADPQAFVAATFDLLEKTKEQLQFIHYLEVLRNVPKGWTVPQRLAYRHWVEYARENFNGGSLFKYFLTMMEDDFNKTLSAAEKSAMAKGTPGPLTPGYEGPVKPKPKAVQAGLFDNRPATNWTFEDLQYSLELVASPRFKKARDFNRGHKMFIKGQCYNCHYMVDKGGNFGPDLTTAGNSFAVEELLKTILYPSEVINSRFQATEYKMKDGSINIGRLVEENGKTVKLQIGFDPANTIEFQKSAVASSGPSTVSEMPPGLINTMSRQEIMDLLYFILQVPGKKTDSLEIDVLENRALFLKGDSALVEMVNYAGRGNIHYTLDGTEPTADAPVYDAPFYVGTTTQIKAKAIDPQATGALVKAGKTVVRSVHAIDTALNGLQWRVYKNTNRDFKLAKNKKGDIEGYGYLIAMSDIIDEENNVMASYDGFIQIPVSGAYTFYTFQDDAAQLYIDDQLVVDAAARKGGKEVKGSIPLKPGMHTLRILYYDSFAEEYLSVEMEGPGMSKQILPGHLLFRRNQEQ